LRGRDETAGSTRLDLYGPANQRRMGWPHAIYGFVQNKAQALLDVSFYKVCDDQKGEIMFERLITAIIMVVAVAIAGSGAFGFINHTIVF
jgi:hypothetical protein